MGFTIAKHGYSAMIKSIINKTNAVWIFDNESHRNGWSNVDEIRFTDLDWAIGYFFIQKTTQLVFQNKAQKCFFFQFSIQKRQKSMFESRFKFISGVGGLLYTRFKLS